MIKDNLILVSHKVFIIVRDGIQNKKFQEILINASSQMRLGGALRFKNFQWVLKCKRSIRLNCTRKSDETSYKSDILLSEFKIIIQQLYILYVVQYQIYNILHQGDTNTVPLSTGVQVNPRTGSRLKAEVQCDGPASPASPRFTRHNHNHHSEYVRGIQFFIVHSRVLNG